MFGVTWPCLLVLVLCSEVRGCVLKGVVCSKLCVHKACMRPVVVSLCRSRRSAAMLFS